MKLTKKLEAEILKVYNTVWDAYLRGDMRTFASILDENCYIIGSAAGEVFKNKKTAVKYYKSTAEQITGKAEFRNRKIQVMPVEQGFMVNEKADFYLLIDDQWTFYGHARISSLFHKKNNKWKVVHQHGSFPDSKTEEGEQVNTDKIKAENIQLRDAVKRRTEELENKNRELEIETSLEKVRTIAMGMRKPEDFPDVCEVLFKELQSLGFNELRNAMVNIHNDEKRSFVNYDYSDEIGKSITPLVYDEHPVIKKQIKQIRKADDAFSESVFKGKDLEDWKTFRKSRGEKNDKRIRNIKALYYYFYSIGTGSIGISTFDKINEEKKDVLKRFRNVFAFAYRRYMDVAQAEAQAKEARVELALERVRARAMAMHNSNELAELVSTVFNELTQLDFKLTSCIIWIHDHENTKNTLWIVSAEMNKSAEPFLVHAFHNDFFKSINHAWKSKDAKWVYTFTGKEKKNFEKAFFKEIPLLPIHLKNALKVPEQVVFSASFNNFGALEIVETEALTEEKFEILHRFGKVFDSSYTRFNDLKKAEAQAREAQVETGLERVRSKTMAMHKSEEVTGIAVSLNEELLKLGFEGGSTIIIIEKETGDTEQWTGFSENKTLQSCNVPYFKHPYHNDLLDTWKRGENFLVYTVTGKEKKTLDEHYFATGYKDFPESDKKWMRQMGSVTFSHAFMKYGAIHWGPGHLTEEQLKILQRFSKVFEQSYTRFLDLQKAEAQAREAQIEAALERVRSSSMAMHKSDDLHEVIKVVTEQLSVLDLKFNVANFAKIDPDGSWDIWLSTPDQTYPALIHVPYLNHPLFNDIIELIAKNKDFYTGVYTREEANIFFHHFFENTIAKNTPEERKQFLYRSDGFARSIFLTKNIWFSVARYDATPFIDEENAIFKRFANVFEQAYTRFLDLQKAEAQAREAQIEASLERVRSRAMAMQNSDELRELIGSVFTELTKLDIVLTRCLIMIYDPKSNDSVWWMANSEAPTEPIGLRIQNHKHPPYAAYLKAWQEKKLNWVYVLEGAVKKDWDDFLFVETELSHLPDFVIAGMKAPERVYLNSSFNSFGNLTLATLEPLSNEHFDILLRFAKVFDLTYTRFNDLKQAEAQTIEAQIELALERVRARTMAMHKSEELAETAQVLFQQLSELGGIPDRISIGIADEKNRVVNFWTTDQQGTHLEHSFSARLNERTTIAKTYHAWKEQKRSLVIDLHGDELKEWIQFAREEMGIAVKEDQIKDRRVHTLAFFSHGWILVSSHEPQSPDTIQILERFASVFNLTYRRFLDLQKAEAQANEARIEIALERIRARALAMHKSDELMEVANVLREQMALLGQPELESSVVHLYEEDPGHILSWRSFRSTDPHSKIAYGHMAIPKNCCEVVREWVTKFYSDLKEYTIEISGAKQEEWYSILFKLAPDVVNSMLQENSIHEKRYYRFSKFSGGALLMVSKQEPSIEVIYLQKRAAVVFDLAYRRFSDLQKTEAQAKEAQIETALEKIRSRSLAMHKSDELQEVVNTVFERLMDLDIEADSSNIAIFKEGSRSFDYWVASKTQKRSASFHMPYVDLSLTKDLIAARESGKEFSTMAYSFEEKNEWFDFAFKETDFKFLSDERKQFILNAPAVTVAIAFSKHTGVQVNRYNSKLLTEAEGEILKRFSKVFEQAYIRFLDLQKAEANAREAQIEAGLERVRSRTMAMHKSDELAETAVVLFKQMIGLGIEPNRLYIAIINDNSGDLEFWITDENGDKVSSRYIVNIHKNTSIKTMYEGWVAKKKTITVDMQGKELEDWLTYWKEEFNVPFKPGAALKRRVQNIAYFSKGFVAIASPDDQPETTINLLERFAAVFNLTYTRFNDLQQAEAQTREAQIEAGLERVRARTMAMHSSEDVGAATATMFTELEKLGIQNLRGGITIIKAGDKQEVWGITNLADGRTIRSIGEFDMHLHPLWRELLKAKLNKGDYIYYRLAGKDKENYLDILNATPNYLSQPIKDFPDVHVQSYFFGEGAIWTNSLEPHSEDQKQTMKRFASVFSLTFRRYQDLKKAEAQAREATIEAALEKVRGNAMAMHNSNDLSVTTSMIISELGKLGIKPIRCGVGIIDKETHKGQLYTARFSPDGDSLSVVGWVLLKGHPVLENIYEKWIAGEDYFPELSGDSRRTYYEQLLAGLSVPVPDFKDEQIHYGHFFSFSVGCLYAWSEVKYNEDEIKILKRFATIIDLTFRRYFELQKSEANAREAIKQAALDRIRADIASMRTINDLERITPLIWNELTVLGIPFIRCGVFIMDEEQQLIHTFLSTPDGKAIAAFHVPYDTPGNLQNVVINWKKKNKYIDHWDETEFIQFADILVKQGALVSAENYLKTIPRGGFYLHFLPFLQGMLYVGNTTQLNNDEIELIQHVADAFSTAYARYEDFNKLEAAKQQVENTLTDLKQAQTQLVQSEKMASLGELTAGIAHEIQNPLNFVNNFSDVSAELLDEMKTELEKGNKEDAIAIVEDVKQNLEKILHHGKRADAIVKGMLQHSRTSSGQKEPTDINMLADEYLRLAFHGLRAKDKSFNAKFETEFDKSIEKINIIPQDIGRVILNLINNAFYAVTEKKKNASAGSAPNGYEPIVTVSTKTVKPPSGGLGVWISVKDNGNGIPKKVLDKIFQPFFTTKPTGQGTGLGLSLAYDIVTKGHGGELKVQTKEGEGSEFIIQLPVSKNTET